MSKQENLKMQTCVLRVNIQCRCDGCKKKIRKLLQKIDGVYSTQVNAEQGRVIVTGNVDPTRLIKKLEKSGKQAELWGPQKGSANNNYHNVLNFKNMQLDGGKGGGGANGGGNNNKSQKGGKGQQQVQQFKGPKDMKMINKMDQKSAKFDDRDNFGASDKDFDDYDDELVDGFEDEEEEEFLGHHGHQTPNKMKGKNDHGPNGPFGMVYNSKGGGGGGGGGNGKKKGGGAIEIPVVMKGKGGSNDGKNGNSGKKGKSGQGGDGKKDSSKGGKDKKQDGKEKNGGKSGGGGLLGFLKRSKSGREIVSDDYDFVDNDIIVSGGKSNNGNGTKKGGSKNEGAHDINKMKQRFHEFDGNGGPRNVDQMGKMGQMNHMGKMGQMNHMGKMGQMGQMNHMGKMGQMGQMNHMEKMDQMGQAGPMGNYGGMGDMPAVQGLPAQPVMNGGYYQGMRPGNPYNQQQYNQQQYNQQQQYMAAMLMNQQRQNGTDMYQPMAYPQPHPGVNYNYMPPPPMPPHPNADPFTHIFSDENTGSCSIM